MDTQDDQPRPDLDAAIDAVLPLLTAVSDDATAASLRRTRLALSAHADARRASVWGGGFAAAAVAGVIVLVSVSLFMRRSPPAGPVANIPPAVVPAASASPNPASPPIAPAAPDRIASAQPTTPRRNRRERAVHPTSISASEPAARPDPLIALTRAVQAIPDDAWSAMARAQDPLSTPELATDPIDVPPLVTPPIGDVPLDPLAEGDR